MKCSLQFYERKIAAFLPFYIISAESSYAHENIQKHHFIVMHSVINISELLDTINLSTRNVFHSMASGRKLTVD